MTSTFCYGAAIALLFIIMLFLFRVLKGPSLFDRLIGLAGISTKAILLLIFIGTIKGSLEMFIDIAIAYALINLVGSLATGKYLEERGQPS